MGRLIDLTGQRFGRLTVVERAGQTAAGVVVWACVCDCGTICDVQGNSLRNGRTKSCGCLRFEKNLSRILNWNVAQGFDGHVYTRLYHVWAGMRERCSNPNAPNYRLYGGRGIYVCKEWDESFELFESWALAHGYAENLTIDRVDVNGGYCPENCRWVPMVVQQNNRRNNRKIEFRGETHTIAEWAKIKNMSRTLLRYRIEAGWSIERALTEPKNKKSQSREP